MSLVERAAKRLEEMARSGSHDTTGPKRPAQEAGASLIERAVRKVAPQVGLAGVQASVTPPAQSQSEASLPEEHLDARREPRLGDAVSSPRIPVQPGAPSQAPIVEIDLSKLAAAGYLEPDAPDSLRANEFRKIKRPLIQACHGKLATPVSNANRIMVTSSVPGEGKSFVAFNLALSMAMERDSTVLLIDADTTRSSVSNLLGIRSRTGLLDLLSGSDIAVSDALLRTSVERLSLLPAGQPRRHATELLASEAMERLVEELASRYAERILIFDTPPLLVAPEAAVLATHMGQIVVVVEADRTTHKVLTSALATIQDCPLVSTILNKTMPNSDIEYYYY